MSMALGMLGRMQTELIGAPLADFVAHLYQVEDVGLAVSVHVGVRASTGGGVETVPDVDKVENVHYAIAVDITVQKWLAS